MGVEGDGIVGTDSVGSFTGDIVLFVGVTDRSSASSSMAVWIARRICDDVEEVDRGLAGRIDLEVGRRAGYVVTEEDESTADVLELNEVLLWVFALELASSDNFDCFVC